MGYRDIEDAKNELSKLLSFANEERRDIIIKAIENLIDLKIEEHNDHYYHNRRSEY